MSVLHRWNDTDGKMKYLEENPIQCLFLCQKSHVHCFGELIVECGGFNAAAAAANLKAKL
jgi:hypothetical protein